MWVFDVYFRHSEGWTPMEAAVKQTRTTRHPLAGGLWRQHGRKDFRNGVWFKEQCMFIEAPEAESSTCRSTSPKGELIESTCDCVIASRRLQGRIKNMEVVEDFDSSPHKAVTLLMERNKAISMEHATTVGSLDTPHATVGATTMRKGKGPETMI